jgi:1-acyl-sn-glycerol-3-phosphate acyltransferase
MRSDLFNNHHILPPIAKRQLAWFTLYLKFYLRRHFHAVRLLRLGDPAALKGHPLLLCLSHPSWWDPLFALYLSRCFFDDRSNYGPIASAGLAKYRFFERLGFFGIDPGTPQGSARFLRIGRSVLARPDAAFWVTAQGAFTDVRHRPVTFAAGVGHLAHRSKRFQMLPLALEYTFWNERTPEALLCFGEPLPVENGEEKTAAEWTRLFSLRLEQTQDALAQCSMQRDPSRFQTLVEGKAGVGGLYDLWRAMKARSAGKPFRPEHGS